MKRILHLSDLHFGRTDPRALECIQRFIREQETKLDLVIVTGDWTQRARAWQFRRARSFLEAISTPVLSLPGNHDVPLFNFFARFFWPFQGYSRFISPFTRVSFSDEEVAVVGISSVNRFTLQDGRVEEAELAKAEVFFQQAKVGALKILCTHHPISQEASDRWLVPPERLSRMRADILLSGHAHRPNIELLDIGGRKVLSAVSGTSASDRLRGEKNSFYLLEIDSRRVKIRNFLLEESGFIGIETNASTFEL